jgi:acetyl-CoA carboxylase biotin carboxyl carrier protein
MRIEEIRRLIDMVQGSDVDEVEVTRWWVHRVRVTRRAPRAVADGQTQVYAVPPASPVAAVPAGPVAAVPAPVADAAPPAPTPAASPAAAAETAEEDQTVAISSPIVGTFYMAPAPGAEPFVQLGDRITRGKTVCIVEAMKIMNEIEAEQDGVLVERLVDDAEPVEFGQPLFKIQPD